MEVVKSIKRRVLDISLAHGLSHVGSSLDAADVLTGIYQNKSPRDLVILSAGHCGLALYCALEAFTTDVDAEILLTKHGEQPHIDKAYGIHCTTGSLGMGITVAVGYAVARPERKVHVVISDGECAEGCVWESLAFIQNSRLENIEVHVIANGYSAISSINLSYLETRLKAFMPRIIIHHPGETILPRGIQSHYKSLTPETHAMAISRLDRVAPGGHQIFTS